jgi:hypothetical protein
MGTVKGTVRSETSAALGTRELSAADLAKLRPYVVNLSQGVFSSDGIFQTSPADVDAIFNVHLPAFLAGKPKETPLVVWAHGGLVGEKSGLRIAQNQVDWWLANGAYPLQFVWESGLLDALKQAASSAVGRRDLWDWTTDPLIEEAVRPLGRLAWSAMKFSAQRASEPGGGAMYVAERLAAFCKAHPEMPLHAVGHSAGAIFHAYFLAAAKAKKVPDFTSLQHLAPAIRVDTFKQLVEPQVGGYARALTVFTMRRELERADNCMGVYHKSLLYLISRALEAERGTPILGLEDSLVGDPHLARLFGLDDNAGKGQVIWSKSGEDAPPGSRSSSTSHGGFDNDADTMDSVVFRIMPKGTKLVPFPSEAAAATRELYIDAGVADGSPTLAGGPSPTVVIHLEGTQRKGKRQALCVGINEYPSPNELHGCVDDARRWSTALHALDFTVAKLEDNEATLDRIIDELRNMAAGARAGDVIVFQYSGHGTEVPDLDGDDKGGTNGDRDEAMCPVDFADGHLLVDDDLRRVIEELPDGVTFTLFADCCHSGSIARVLAPRIDVDARVAGDVRTRYLPMTEPLARAYRAAREAGDGRDRQDSGGAGTGMPRRTAPNPSATFSACADWQVALEHGGQGDFTKHCIAVLSDGVDGITNEDFLARVVKEFGPAPEQQPELDQARLIGPLPFLQPPGARRTQTKRDAVMLAGYGIAPANGAERLLHELASRA